MTIPVFMASLVLLGAPCGLMQPDRTSVASTGHVTITRFGPDGRAIVQCHGYVDAPGVAMRLDYANTGIECGAGLGSTQDWAEQIAPDGQANLVCRLVGNR